MNGKSLTRCLACDRPNLVPILDLGEQPLANSFLKPEEFATEQKYPLAVNTCPTCFHTQLSYAVNPDLMFKNYLYVSGTSNTLKEYMEWFADFAWDTYTLYNNEPYLREPAFLDIACNDCTQLDAAKRAGFKTYGIDPAENLYKLTRNNHTIHCGYLDNSSQEAIMKKLHTNSGFKVINAQNVFAHNSNPLAFMKLCEKMLSDNGILFIQNSQADMIKNGEFDTIYHEHISFWNANSIDHCARRAGLVMVDRIRVPVHGISDMFLFRKRSCNPLGLAKLDNILAMEKLEGLHNIETYREFGNKAKEIIQTALDWSIKRRFTQTNKIKIVGVGAAAKGMTFLNAANIKLDYIIDENPLKIGLYSPGQHIPIVGMDFIKPENPHEFVILAWNFKEEIKEKLRKAGAYKTDYIVTFMPKYEVDYLGE